MRSIFVAFLFATTSFYQSLAQEEDLTPKDCPSCINPIEFEINAPEDVDAIENLHVVSFGGFRNDQEFDTALNVLGARLQAYDLSSSDLKLNIVMADGSGDGAALNADVRVETNSIASENSSPSDLESLRQTAGITSQGQFADEGAREYLQTGLQDALGIKNSVITQIDIGSTSQLRLADAAKPKSKLGAIKAMFKKEYSPANLAISLFIGVARTSVTTATLVITNGIPFHVALPASIFIGLYSGVVQYLTVPYNKYINSPKIFGVVPPVDAKGFGERLKKFATFHGKRFADSFMFLSALKTSFAIAGATMTNGVIGAFGDVVFLTLQGLVIGAPWAYIMSKVVTKDPGLAGRKGYQRYVNTTSISLTLAVIWQVVGSLQVAGLQAGNFTAYAIFALGSTVAIFQTVSSKTIYDKLKDTISKWVRGPDCARVGLRMMQRTASQ